MCRFCRQATGILLLCFALMLTGCGLLERLQEKKNGQAMDLPRNQTDMASFSTEEDGAVTYPGALQGIDVSAHQQEIDWQRVRAAGIDFAILQIGYRGYGEAGTLNQDARFEENYAAARAADVSVGVYFYSQATSIAEAEAEAEFVLEILDNRVLDLPVFYEWEEVQTGRTNGFANLSVGDYAAAFCEAITAGGYRAGVYFNQKYGYSIMRLEHLKDYTFWLAEYSSYQSFGYAVNIWQYTGNGRVDGIGLKVDRNLMYVGEEDVN